MLYTKSVFISAELSNKDKAENKERTAFLRGTLKLEGYNFIEVIGVYKGETEVSFQVESLTPETTNKLSKLAFGNYKQESIGILSEDSSFILEYSDGKVEGLGYLQFAPNKYIEQLENYSVINGSVYTTELK